MNDDDPLLGLFMGVNVLTGQMLVSILRTV